jgi:hypothetical protein
MLWDSRRLSPDGGPVMMVTRPDGSVWPFPTAIAVPLAGPPGSRDLYELPAELGFYRGNVLGIPNHSIGLVLIRVVYPIFEMVDGVAIGPTATTMFFPMLPAHAATWAAAFDRPMVLSCDGAEVVVH